MLTKQQAIALGTSGTMRTSSATRTGMTVWVSDEKLDKEMFCVKGEERSVVCGNEHACFFCAAVGDEPTT